MLPGLTPGKSGRGESYYIRSADPRAPLPANDADIAFSSVAQLSRWIQSRQITSERLTHIYLDRLKQFDPKAALCDHADGGTRPCAGEAC